MTLSIPATTVTGRVEKVIRHGATINGNPMMSVGLRLSAIDGTPAESSELVTVRLQNDSGLAYAIENAEFRNEDHTFTLTKAGRINGYQH